MGEQRVCVILANGFEEIEAVTLIDVLRRAGIGVTTLGVESTRVEGAHAIAMEADARLEDGADTPWDMVILPGGQPGANTLRDHPGVQALLGRQHQQGRPLAAICAAPIALGKAGILEGKRATSYPGFESQLRGATVVQDRVVQDGNLVTSRGPGTAMEMALHLVALLASDAAAADLRAGMLV
jgi:4-methyl-5(b-hydroxyethyl)-thiazole monophosphate biosynthesis